MAPRTLEVDSTAERLRFAQIDWRVRRPKPFVLVIEGPGDGEPGDYLHERLLAPAWREGFLALIDSTGLVVCLNLPTRHPSYRDVRGRSSKGRLSQGEYYHHDGCSSPQKPRVVEIRCPYQTVARSVATAVAPHHAVLRAMVDFLPEELAQDERLAGWGERLRGGPWPSDAELDHLQGQLNRLLRRKLAAEDARAYFRRVDAAADAYVEPWAMGESRLIANAPHTPGANDAAPPRLPAADHRGRGQWQPGQALAQRGACAAGAGHRHRADRFFLQRGRRRMPARPGDCPARQRPRRAAVRRLKAGAGRFCSRRARASSGGRWTKLRLAHTPRLK